MPSLDQIVVWIVVGLLGGSLAGLIITWDRKGLGLLRNLAVGLAGALIGGFIFRMLGLLPGSTNSRSRCAMSWPPSSDRCWCSRAFGCGSGPGHRREFRRVSVPDGALSAFHARKGRNSGFPARHQNETSETALNTIATRT
jgi:uncharacterized membrane protein YeaQ/YmgE (transglycosylase-associated protein family)